MIEEIIVKTEDHIVVSINDAEGYGLHSVAVYDKQGKEVMHCSCEKFIDNVQDLVGFIGVRELIEE